MRDMDAGRYGEDCTVVLVTHGLASRIFLMRFFHWTVQQFLEVGGWDTLSVCAMLWQRECQRACRWRAQRGRQQVRSAACPTRGTAPLQIPEEPSRPHAPHLLAGVEPSQCGADCDGADPA